MLKYITIALISFVLGASAAAYTVRAVNGLRDYARYISQSSEKLGENLMLLTLYMEACEQLDSATVHSHEGYELVWRNLSTTIDQMEVRLDRLESLPGFIKHWINPDYDIDEAISLERERVRSYTDWQQRSRPGFDSCSNQQE